VWGGYATARRFGQEQSAASLALFSPFMGGSGRSERSECRSMGGLLSKQGKTTMQCPHPPPRVFKTLRVLPPACGEERHFYLGELSIAQGIVGIPIMRSGFIVNQKFA